MMANRMGVEHFGYKVIALLITLILWVTVVSQREMTTVQKVKVQFVAPIEFQIIGPNEFDVDVRLEGPRPFLKKYIERSWLSTIVVPVRNPTVGPYPAEIPVSDFQLPSEIKIITVQPREIVLQISKLPKQ